MTLTNIIRHWDKIEALRRGDKIWPSMASFHTSNLCNQHCIGCAHDGTHTNEIMPEEDHFRLVDDLLSVGVKAFDFAGGGEPLLQPYLGRLMKHIYEHGGWSGILTNGLALNDEMIQALVDYATYARFSLEASCQDDYVNYKRVPRKNWETVLDNIARLQVTKKSFGSRLEVSIKFSVGKMLRGQEHYMRCIELGEILNAERITIKALRYYGQELSVEERLEEDAIFRTVIHCLRSNNVNYWIRQIGFDRVPQCWLNPMQVIFDHAGNMSVCCYRYWDRDEELGLGNIYEHPFKDLWMDDSHWDKIKKIDRRNCARADCKFFRHHEAVKESLRRNHVEFI